MDEQQTLSPLSREGEYILQSWKEFTQQTKQHGREDMVSVSETFGVVAYLYEKLRAAVEYKGEHVLRRATIERMLNRILFLPKSSAQKADLLIQELVWSRFLRNDSVPKTKLPELTTIIEKYSYFLANPEAFKNLDFEWQVWLVGVASTEIEELLVPSYLRTVLAPLFYAWLKKTFTWDQATLSSEDRDIQLFIAAERALAKADQPILGYRLLLLLLPEWMSADSKRWPMMLENLPAILAHIEHLLDYPQRNLVFRFANQFAPVFTVLHDLLTTTPNPEQLFTSPDQLAERSREVVEAKYQKLHAQVVMATFRSIIYLLITKVLIALIIELPYEFLVVKELKPIPLIINVMLPPAIMLLVGLSIRIPGEDNTQRIIEQLTGFIFDTSEDPKPIPARLTLTDRQKRLSRYFTWFYGAVFVVLMYLISWFLMSTLQFNVVNLGLFFMFLSLVLLFGYRVRWESQTLTMAKPRRGVFRHMVSILTMPFINLGAWLSAGLAQINIFMFLLDVVIDAPLKALVASIEEWSQFMRRKEEEMVEVPSE